MIDTETESRINRVAELIVQSQRTVVFTGAGISTESGIPDFRGPGGIWEHFEPDDFAFDRFVNNIELRRMQWHIFKEGLMTDKAEPNAAHHAVAELYRMGRLDCVITQNIDNLHQKAEVPNERVFELHGNMRWAVCLDCGRRYSFTEIRKQLDGGEEIPDCVDCRGMLKPDVVMFGEQLPARVLREASGHALSSDLFIVVGSTLVVYPAAQMPRYALRAGAKLVIINMGPTPLDRQAEVLIDARAGETMEAIVAGVRELDGDKARPSRPGPPPGWAS